MCACYGGCKIIVLEASGENVMGVPQVCHVPNECARSALRGVPLVV